MKKAKFMKVSQYGKRYAIYYKNKLCSIKCCWNTETENHYVPLIFETRKEAERFAYDDYIVKEVKVVIL